MNSYYYTNIAYPAALDEAMSVLVDMRRNIDKYKLRNDARQSWIDRQENALAHLVHFIETTKATFELLQEEFSEARKEGFSSGKRQAEKEFKHQEDFGNLKFDNPNDKERIRAATILNAQMKWDF